MKAAEGEARCDNPRKGGGLCDRPAGFGTDHPGTGRCRIHGGALPSHIKSVANAELALLIDEPIDIDPAEALLWCVALTAQEVSFANVQISKLSEPTHMTMVGEQLDIWIQTRISATDRLARYSKMALDAGVNERMLQLAERMADFLVPVLQGILDDLGLTPKQKKVAPAVIGRHLRAIEGGSAGALPLGPRTPKTAREIA